MHVEFTLSETSVLCQGIDREMSVKQIHDVESDLVNSQSFNGTRLGLELSVEGLIAVQGPGSIPRNA